jgi:hypothetical protein
MSEASELLRAHLLSGRFRAGELRGRWKVLEFAWPHVIAEVVARDGRRLVLRFDCTGYPEQPPTAMPWDCRTGAMLSSTKWPRGGRVSQVFNPGWKNGTALYLPCDRESIAGHPNWHSEYPWLIWKPERGLAQYVEAVHELLQSHELIAQAA